MREGSLVATIDWERMRLNKISKEPPPKHWNWPKDVRPISMEGLTLFGIKPDANKLYWDGKEVVVRDALHFEWPERLFAFLVAVGTFGYFIMELGKLLKWWG
jgi:hypothetical protein